MCGVHIGLRQSIKLLHVLQQINFVLRFKAPNYLIGILTHAKMCFADAIHNLK